MTILYIFTEGCIKIKLKSKTGSKEKKVTNLLNIKHYLTDKFVIGRTPIFYSLDKIQKLIFKKKGIKIKNDTFLFFINIFNR